MDLVQDIHSVLRWGVLAVAAAGLVHSLVKLLSASGGPVRPHRALAGAFLGILDLQFLLGVLILIMDPASRMPGLPHALVMLSALVMAHLLRVQARKVPPAAQGRIGAALFAVPLGIILVGLLLLP